MKARHGMLGLFTVVCLAMAVGMYMGYAQGPIPPGANLPAASDNETDLNPDAECCCECALTTNL